MMPSEKEAQDGEPPSDDLEKLSTCCWKYVQRRAQPGNLLHLPDQPGAGSWLALMAPAGSYAASQAVQADVLAVHEADRPDHT